MTDQGDATHLRKWLWVLRSQALASAACGVLALALIQAADPSASAALVLVAVVAAVTFGALIGNVAGNIVVNGGRPVRWPRSIFRSVAALAIAGLVGLIVSLVAARLGLQLRFPAATFIAICPLLALVGSEIVYGLAVGVRD